MRPVLVLLAVCPAGCPALVLRSPVRACAARPRAPPALRMCSADDDTLGRLTALPSDPLTTALQMRGALAAALAGRHHNLAVSIAVPELDPKSRGYDLDAHAMLGITAAQSLVGEHGTVSMVVHTLDCALRAQLVLRETAFADQIDVRCAAWADDGGAAATGGAVVVVGPDGEAEPATMRRARVEAQESGAPVVLLNHRPLGVGGRLKRRLGVELDWAPRSNEALVYELLPLVLRRRDAPSEAAAKLLVRRTYPGGWVLMVDRRDGAGYVEVARRSTRPSPKTMKALTEAAAGVGAASPASAGATTAGAEASVADDGGSGGDEQCRVCTWTELNVESWGLRAYCDACLLRMRDADSDWSAADKLPTTRHIFFADSCCKAWQQQSLQLTACAVLSLDGEAAVAAVDALGGGAAGRGAASGTCARLEQVCVAAADTAGDGSSDEAEVERRVVEVLAAAEKAAEREGATRLEVELGVVGPTRTALRTALACSKRCVYTAVPNAPGRYRATLDGGSDGETASTSSSGAGPSSTLRDPPAGDGDSEVPAPSADAEAIARLQRLFEMDAGDGSRDSPPAPPSPPPPAPPAGAAGRGSTALLEQPDDPFDSGEGEVAEGRSQDEADGEEGRLASPEEVEQLRRIFGFGREEGG